MTMKRFLALFLAVCMTLTLAACGGGSSAPADTATAPASTGSAPAPAATTGSAPAASGAKTVSVGITTAQADLDPISSSDGFYVMLLGNILGGLYCVDENNVLQLDLAEKAEVSDDGLVYTFTIRDTKWSNGDPVTANDFVFAWRRLADPTSGTQYAYLVEEANIKNGSAVTTGEMDPSELGVTALDDKTLQVELEVPTPYFASLTAFSPLCPLNEKFVTEQGDQFALTKDNYLYSGPYMLSEWDVASNTVSMVKNPSYWDTANVDVDQVNFQQIVDPQTGVMSYENGDLDRVTVSGNLVGQYATSPEFSSALGVFNWYLYFNAEKVTNQKLRQAIAYSVDREALVNNIMRDGSVSQYNLLMTGLYADENGNDFNDACGNHYEVDKAKAAQLWAEAKAEGAQTKLTLTYEEDTTIVANVAAYVQSEIETTLDGFTVELQCIPKKNRITNMQNGDYEVALHRWGPDYADPSCIMALYTTDSPYNYSNWSDAEYDQMNKDCSTTLILDNKARWNKYIEAEQRVMDAAVSVPLYQVAEAVLNRSTVHGITNHITGVSCYYKFVTVD